MAPLSRIVTGTWYTADALPDGGAEITYTLDPSSYTGDALISGGPIPDVANELGESATALWTNEDGYDPTRYIVTWPSGRQDTFTLPAGDDPIALNTLLQTAEIITWPPSVIEDYLEAFRDEIYSSFASTEPDLGDALVGYRAPLTGAIGRTVHARLADEAVNIRDFGAVADDVMVYDGAMVSGDTTVTSMSSTFTDADIGKAFSLVGAGVSKATLNGTFTARLSGTQMQSSVAASTTVSGQALGYGTENAAAWTLAMAAAGPDGVMFIPPGLYYMNVGVDLTPVRAIIGYGAVVRRGLAGNIRVKASNVHMYGLTFRYENTLDNQRRTMFENKDTATGEIAGNHTGLRFTDCVFDGLTVAASKLNRQGNAQYAAFTNLSSAAAIGASTLNVTSGAAIADAAYLRIGPVVTAGNPDFGLYLYPSVVSIDVPGNKVTISPPLSGDLAIGQYVSQVTRLNGAHTAGATVLTLENTAHFVVGNYAQVFISQTVRFLPFITEVTGTTITIATPLPQNVADDTSVAPMGAGILTSGSDIAGDIVFSGCEIKNVRNQVGLSLSGIDDATVSNCHIHDIYTYLVPGDPSSGFNTSLGEAMKVTVGSTRVKVIGSTIERYARDGIDCYDAGELQVIGNSFNTSYIGNSLECKWLSTNINAPQPIQIIGNRIQKMFSNGIQLGGQDFIMSSNHIEDCRSMGIYCNGGHPDDADTQASRNYALSGNIVKHNGWKEALTILVRGRGGTWTIGANGLTTAPIAYGAAAWRVQLALEALGGLAALAGVTRAGTGPYVYTIDPPGLVDLPTITASGAGLLGRDHAAIVAVGEVSNGGSGIYVAEVLNAVITGNRAYDNAVAGLDLQAYATNATISGNSFTGNGVKDIRVYGVPGRVTGHVITANQYDSVYREGTESGVVWDGMGVETGLAAGAAPTLTLWPRMGTLVTNATDGTLWQRDVAAWLPVGSSSEVMLATPIVWNGMTGATGNILTVAGSPYVIDASLLGVPASAKSITLEVAGRWTAASHNNSCTISAGASGAQGGRAGLFRSMGANIGNDTQVKVTLVNKQFRIAIAGADMDTAYVGIKGWVI